MVRSRFAGFLTNLLYPHNRCCIICDRVIDNSSPDGIICSICENHLQKLSAWQHQVEKDSQSLYRHTNLGFLHCAFPYSAEAKVLIYRLKYDCNRHAAIPIVRHMLDLEAGEEDLLVPIPTTPARKHERGFNQATVITQRLAQLYGMEWRNDVLFRKDHATSQTKLSIYDRMKNVSGLMHAKSAVQGRKILLIDDVYTTGSSAAEAARALLMAGCKSVGMFAVCRAGKFGGIDAANFLPEITKNS